MEGQRENEEFERNKLNKDGVGIIPTDVLFGILIRLPVKSLGRFKMVSKPWQSLIEDRNFVQSHYQGSQEEKDTSRQYLMFEVSPYKNEQEGGKAKCSEVDKYDQAVEVKGPEISYKAIAFCEGLVCYLGMDEDVHVVNPITQQTLTLPKPQCFRTRSEGTEYQYNRHALGFEFDSVSSKYKVVLVVLDLSQDCNFQLTEMFTLGSKSKSWKKIHSGILYTRVPFQGAPVYVNGASYWTSFQNDIVSFNFTQEKFGDIPLCGDMYEFLRNTYDDHKWQLCKKREHLCVIGIESSWTVKVWTLTNYDDVTPEWVVQKIIMPFETVYKHVRFIAAATGDDELWVVCCDFPTPDEMWNARCDIRTKPYKTYIYSYNEHGAVVNSREVCHFPENYGFTGFHVESIVNPKDI